MRPARPARRHAAPCLHIARMKQSLLGVGSPARDLESNAVRAVRLREGRCQRLGANLDTRWELAGWFVVLAGDSFR